jgi:flagellar hook-basal body complex protein FliE
MAIGAIPAFTPIVPATSGFSGAGALGQTAQGVQGATGAVGSATGGGDFVASLTDAAGALAEADALGRQLATGQLTDIQEYMAAATKANLSVEFVVAVRDRAVEAFQEIMRMQV